MPTYHPTSFNTSVARPISKKVSALLKGPNPPRWAISLVKLKAQQHARWRVPGTPFLVGQKKVYLPNFYIALRRTPNLSPHWAQFEVPLWFNKLDMRDYLFHAYSVQIKSVRTFIPWTPVTQRMLTTKRGQRKMYRPRGIKKMTVELEKPFVWPDPPEDFTKWDKERYDLMFNKNEDQKVMERRNADASYKRRPVYFADRPENTSLRRQAERLLRGEVKWSTTDPSAISSVPEGTSLPHR